MPNPSTRASMTIGAFSQLNRLSLKALRLYDALGLLAPMRTDEASGYRYYAAGQLERARQISLLLRGQIAAGQFQRRESHNQPFSLAARAASTRPPAPSLPIASER